MNSRAGDALKANPPGINPAGWNALGAALIANLHAPNSPTVLRHHASTNDIATTHIVVIVAAIAVGIAVISDAIAQEGEAIPAIVSAAIAITAETAVVEAAMVTTCEPAAMEGAAVKAAASTMEATAAETTSMTAATAVAAAER
jgi:hypothetical protein